MGKGFFRENAQVIESTLQLLDLLFILLSFLIAAQIRLGSLELTTERLLVVVSAMFCAHTVFSLSGIYRRWRGKTVWAEIAALAVNYLIVLFILGFFFYLSKTGEAYSRIWVVLAFVLSFALTSSSRIVIRTMANWRRRNGFNTRTLLIVGGGELGVRVARNLAKNSWTGIRVIGFVDDELAADARPYGNLRVLGKVAEAQNIVESYRRQGKIVDYVWVALPATAKAQVEVTIEELLDSTVSISVVPDYFDVQLMQARIDTVADIPLVNLSNSRMYGISGISKLAFDFVLATLILILISPLLLIIAILVKLDSSGPVLFVQRRYGIDGKEIDVYKFRSMTVQEDGEVVTQATKNDKRVTRIGAVLRRTSLDELPQFFNVLEGKMSIVGPRPHAVAHNEIYRKRIKGYMTRHVIKPGITGLAQINGCRGETETDEKMTQRVEYDLTYINRWSLGLDFKIILLTLREVLMPRNVY